jgi:hypothetical protein
MARHTLFAYVDGSDLAGIATELESRFEAFVQAYSWRATPTVVNQIQARDSTMGADDLPDWDLGLNMALPDPDQEPLGWFSEVERIVSFLAELHRATGREFVLGVHDGDGGFSEDLFSVDRDTPDGEEFRTVLGVRKGAR